MGARHICFCISLGAIISLTAIGNSSPSTVETHFSSSKEHLANKRFEELMSLSFAKMQSLSPELATFVGATRDHNGRWTEHTEEAYFREAKTMEMFLARLNEVDSAELTQNNRINLELLKELCLESLESHAFGMHVVPLDHLSGIPFDIESVLQAMPCNDRLDYVNILLRLKGIPQVIDETIDLLKKGIERGVTLPKIVMEKLLKNVHRMTPDDRKHSIFYEPFLRLGKTEEEFLSHEEVSSFQKQALSIIDEEIYPAYHCLHGFLASEYSPACRQSVGACALPNGKAWYEFLVRRHTTTRLTPEEIHAMGLNEVKRIRQEIQKIIEESGFSGTIQDYFTYLNTSPEFFYDDAESLLEGYRELTRYIDSRIHQLFNRLPKLSYEVVPIRGSECGQIGAYYMSGSPVTGRPGKFFVNTFDLTERPKWQMETLALHEAVPGHHFQISIAQEIEGMPEFRKYVSFYTAYVEGWGLYSESLGKDIGLCKTPENRVGRLIAEVWRAARLVVDTGIHALGWSRDQAISYLTEQSGMSEKEATVEIDRYIVWPAQALAYKVGELSIMRWREEAKQILGSSFDIREFHDKLLELGALPLDVCERELRRSLLP